MKINFKNKCKALNSKIKLIKIQIELKIQLKNKTINNYKKIIKLKKFLHSFKIKNNKNRKKL